MQHKLLSQPSELYACRVTHPVSSSDWHHWRCVYWSCRRAMFWTLRILPSLSSSPVCPCCFWLWCAQLVFHGLHFEQGQRPRPKLKMWALSAALWSLRVTCEANSSTLNRGGYIFQRVKCVWLRVLFRVSLWNLSGGELLQRSPHPTS